MAPDAAEFRSPEKALTLAAKDEAAQAAREQICDLVNGALLDYGLKLFAAGQAFGGGPAKATDPELKDLLERMIGLACVLQVAGELGTASVELFKRHQNYAAYALVRQIVECEYLTWAFADDVDDAREWLNTTRSERLKFWAPRHMRARSGSEFRSKDYAVHCEIGGHPTPRAFQLLGSTQSIDSNFLWGELANHIVNVWSHATRAIPDFIRPLLDRKPGPQGSMKDVIRAVNDWIANEPISKVIAQLPDFPDLK